jgi:hypothetical protein
MIWTQELMRNPQAQADFQNQDANSGRDADPKPNRTLTSIDLYTITKAQNARSEACNDAPCREAGDSKIEERDKNNGHVAPNYY